MVIHFPQLPATFLHIPRTAGTSFKVWVEANIQPFEPVPHTPYTPENISKKPNRDYVSSVWPNLGTEFTFVRNPFDRLVSLYHYMGQWAEARVVRTKSLLASGDTTNWKTHPYQNENIVASIVDDTRLVELYNKGFDYWFDAVFFNRRNLYSNTRPHSKHLIDQFWAGETQVSWFNGTLPNIIVKVEDLSTDFIKIQQLMNCFEPLPVENTTVRKPYKDYYSQSTRQTVEMLFADDLNTFNYEF